VVVAERGEAMKVEALMHRDVVTVRRDTPLREVARLLVEQRVSGLPVVDEAGAVVGVVSEADFLIRERGEPTERPRWLERVFRGGEGLTAEELVKVRAMTAAEAMTAPAVVVDPATTVESAARTMIERRINRLPVVSRGRLVGIVTRADVVRAFVRTDDELREAIIDDVVRRAMWLDGRDLAITVTDGVVRIAGTLERRTDVATIEQLVRAIPGVLDVTVEADWRVDDPRVEAPVVDMVSPPYGPR
jgi:CBS domain-containing protein